MVNIGDKVPNQVLCFSLFLFYLWWLCDWVLALVVSECKSGYILLMCLP